MPVGKVPQELKSVDGILPLPSQIALIQSLAREIDKQDDVEWQLEVFRTIHEIRDNRWVQKEFVDDASIATVEKQDDGGYWITTVSTAALPDREDETFDTPAMDYDVSKAESSGIYPEYRLFHTKSLGIGKVEKMRRVGIFLVDEGSSYKDPFSIAVCEKMLSNNDGKWRVSRGFFAEEVFGRCRSCDSGLLVRKEHMQLGFKCPTCDSVYPTYKHQLKNVRFTKARTFDVTITDIPCVPWTSASAIKLNSLEDISMTKKEMRKKLLDAGIPEDWVDERLKEVSDEQLKEMNDIPKAILKEYKDSVEEKEVEEVEEEGFVLDESVMKEIGEVVEAKVSSLLDGLTLEIAETKEAEQLAADVAELKEMVASLVEKIDALSEEDGEKVRKQLQDMPRANKLRIRRFKQVPETKSKKKDMMMDEEPSDTGDEEPDPDDPNEDQEQKKEAHILASDGSEFTNMTDFVLGKNGRR